MAKARTIADARAARSLADKPLESMIWAAC
jgi:hypothetical protein